MEQNIYGTSAPHKKGTLTTKRIMQYVLLALLPAGIYGILHFGRKAAMILAITCICAVVTEVVTEKLLKEPVRAGDLRILVTGVIMAYCLPPTVDWYLAAIAGVLCALFMTLGTIVFEKNIVSPVILTRLILMYTFREQMSYYALDGLTMATPLRSFQGNGLVSTLNMILGNVSGCIGETSTILLCMGAIFLIVMGIMDFRVAGMYLFSFAAFMAVFGGYGLSSYYLTVQLAGGGFMLALWFIAPAYSTLPITKGGRWLYGIVLGVFTGFFRLFGPNTENLCFAILLANLTVPLLEKITIRRPFGVEKGNL